MNQKKIMRQTINEAQLYGEKLAAVCPTISQYFQHGKKQEGISLLGQFIEGVEWFSYAVHLTEPLQAERDVCIDFNQLPGSLDPLVEALENQDYGLVADILLHEVQPILRSWSTELSKSVTVE